MTPRYRFASWSLCLLALASVPPITGRASQPPREKPVDRTTPRLARLTPPQREHAKLHAGRSKNLGNTKVLDEKLSLDVTSDFGWMPPSRTARSLVTEMVCAADAVFVGNVVKGEAMPTEDGRFLFTDYDVHVLDVLKTSKGVRLFQGDTAIVTRIGGELEVDGASLFAKTALFPLFEQGGMYAFFVDYLPRYKTFDSNFASGTFAITDGRARSLIPLSAKDVDFAGQGIAQQELALLVGGARCR